MTVKTLQLIANVHLTADFPVFDVYEILDEETGEALHDLDGVGAQLIMGLRGRGLTVNDFRKQPEDGVALSEEQPKGDYHDHDTSLEAEEARPKLNTEVLLGRPTPDDPRPLPDASKTLYGKGFVSRTGAAAPVEAPAKPRSLI